MKCNRCGWEWKPRVKNPVECPSCKQNIKENVAKRIAALKNRSRSAVNES